MTIQVSTAVTHWSTLLIGCAHLVDFRDSKLALLSDLFAVGMKGYPVNIHMRLTELQYQGKEGLGTAKVKLSRYETLSAMVHPPTPKSTMHQFLNLKPMQKRFLVTSFNQIFSLSPTSLNSLQAT